MESMIFFIVFVVVIFWWTKIWHRLFGWYVVESGRQENVKKDLQEQLYQEAKAAGSDADLFVGWGHLHTVLRVKWMPGVLRSIFGSKPISISYVEIGTKWYELPGLTEVSWFVRNFLRDEDLRLYRMKIAVVESKTVDILSTFIAEAQKKRGEL